MMDLLQSRRLEDGLCQGEGDSMMDLVRGKGIR